MKFVNMLMLKLYDMSEFCLGLVFIEFYLVIYKLFKKFFYYLFYYLFRMFIIKCLKVSVLIYQILIIFYF